MLDEVGPAVVWGFFGLLLESRLGWLITIPLLAIALYMMIYVHFTAGLIFSAFAVVLMAIQIRGTIRRRESSNND